MSGNNEPIIILKSKILEPLITTLIVLGFILFIAIKNDLDFLFLFFTPLAAWILYAVQLPYSHNFIVFKDMVRVTNGIKVTKNDHIIDFTKIDYIFISHKATTAISTRIEFHYKSGEMEKFGFNKIPIFKIEEFINWLKTNNIKVKYIPRQKTLF